MRWSLVGREERLGGCCVGRERREKLELRSGKTHKEPRVEISKRPQTSSTRLESRKRPWERGDSGQRGSTPGAGWGRGVAASACPIPGLASQGASGPAQSVSHMSEWKSSRLALWPGRERRRPCYLLEVPNQAGHRDGKQLVEQGCGRKRNPHGLHVEPRATGTRGPLAHHMASEVSAVAVPAAA